MSSKGGTYHSGPLRFLRLFEVEESVHTQILRHVALVVAKSAPVGTPMRGHPSLRSLAPPLPGEPAALGFAGSTGEINQNATGDGSG